jgi:hypothetical protein
LSRAAPPSPTVVEPVDPNRLALAIHEAAHAVATVLLGHRIDGLTIDLDEGWSGCSFWSADPLPESALDCGGRIFFLDWRVRKRLEDDLALTLAAHVAVAIWAPLETGYRSERASASECERLARELEQSGFSERVERRNATPPLERQSDEHEAFKLSRLGSSGQNTAPAFLAWMLTEVRDWVGSPEFSRPLAAVTAALLKHDSLSGAEVHRLVGEKSFISREREKTMARTKARSDGGPNYRAITSFHTIDANGNPVWSPRE